MIQEKLIDGFLYTTDKSKVDISYVHHFLSTKSYWAQEIPVSLVTKSIDHSITICILDQQQQVGFARVVTDHATFAYLGDVFVDENYRGKGLSKRLMEFILSLDEVQDFRRFILGTRDAHSLYAQFGFRPIGYPDRFMEIHRPDPYRKSHEL